MDIPLMPLAVLRGREQGLINSRLLDRLQALFTTVSLREAMPGDGTRWREHTLAGKTLRFAQPLTFTPYASARPCSARCRFCSETLKDEASTGPLSALLRPGPGYFDALRQVLGALQGLPLSYSLSGLESTDDPDWLLALLDTLVGVGSRGPAVEGAVLYTNGAGLADHGARLLPALQRLGVNWIEWSRHHDDAQGNQRIMRFRPGQRVARAGDFHEALHATGQLLPVKLVCVVQRGGIECAEDVLRYLAWVRPLGVRAVIFREFSELPPHYRPNATRRYIDQGRVRIDDLLQACLDAPAFRRAFQPLTLTKGYYFWNARWQAAEGMEVVFERSDYQDMHAKEASGLVYKLVFHPNEHLCAGWQSDKNILWRPDERQ